VSRKLLAVSVEVDFYIVVTDAAAGKAMVSSDNLEIAKLNSELAKQDLAINQHFCLATLFALHPPARGRE
jgi:hypothetical protein